MDKYTSGNIAELFEGVAAIFAEKKAELCELDANMGDGDLGLTMDKGYGALPEFIRQNEEAGDVGKTLFKGGMKMSSQRNPLQLHCPRRDSDGHVRRCRPQDHGRSG